MKKLLIFYVFLMLLHWATTGNTSCTSTTGAAGEINTPIQKKEILYVTASASTGQFCKAISFVGLFLENKCHQALLYMWKLA